MTVQLADYVDGLNVQLLQAEHQSTGHLADTPEFMAALANVVLMVVHMSSGSEQSVSTASYHLEQSLNFFHWGQLTLQKRAAKSPLQTWQPGVPLVAMSAFVGRLLKGVTEPGIEEPVNSNILYFNMLVS